MHSAIKYGNLKVFMEVQLNNIKKNKRKLKRKKKKDHYFEVIFHKCLCNYNP